MSTVDTKIKTAEIRVGSDSDLPKIKLLIDVLRENNINVLVRILSAHRTPDAMTEAAKNFPDVHIVGVDHILDQTKLDISLCFAAAGGSAHIAGMTASETNTAVIAYPVESSAAGIMDSTYSMINMPPGIPNGFQSDQRMAALIGKDIMNLSKEKLEKIYIPTELIPGLLPLIEQFGVGSMITDSDKSYEADKKPSLGIYTCTADQVERGRELKSKIQIIIPTVAKQLTYETLGDVTRTLHEYPGLSMGLQLADKVNATNAFLYCMKIVALFNPEVDKKLTAYREKLAKEVKEKDIKLVNDQINQGHLNNALDVVLPERYKRVHGGKVRETYENPDNANELIMIATDRISTHDVVHKNRIPGKGEALTQISNFRFEYFKTQDATKDIPTQQVEGNPLPADFPPSYANSAIVVKKLKPLPIEAIVREYLYGSALEDSDGNKYDPETGKLFTGEYVGEGLKKCSKFKEPLFTPSTKAAKGHDKNINKDKMVDIIRKWLEENQAEFADRAEEYAKQVEEYSLRMFTTARDYATTKGITIADTKFEFAIDEKGVLHIIDEIITPDSSRFWKTDSIQEGEEPIQFDKQPARAAAIKIWKGGKKVPVTFPPEAVEATGQRYGEMKRIFSQAA